MGEVGEVNDEVEEECGVIFEGLFKGWEIILGIEGEGYIQGGEFLGSG